MSSLNSQVPIEWYPDDGVVYYDINRNILSKPFCSTSQNAIRISTLLHNYKNPNYDEMDNGNTLFEVEFLLLAQAYIANFPSELIFEELKLDLTTCFSTIADIEYIGDKDISNPITPNDRHGFFFRVNLVIDVPNNQEYISCDWLYKLNIIQNHLNESPPSSGQFSILTSSYEDFDFESFDITDVWEMDVISVLTMSFKSRAHVLIDGSTSSKNLSDFIHDEPKPSNVIPAKLAHPEVACLLEDGYELRNNLMVKGDLVIDVDYCFSNDASHAHSNPEVWPSESSTLNYRYIYMGPDARLIIQSGVEFTMDRTIITSCDVLWNSIVVEDGAILNINESYIRDGLHAIHVKPEGILNISRNIFDANHISLYSEDSPDPESYEIEVRGFYGNEFVNKSDFKEYPESYQGGEFGRPYAAIQIRDITNFSMTGMGQLGEVEYNVIDNMMYGIMAYRTGLNLSNYQIKNIRDDGDGIGVAILLEQSGFIVSEIVGSGKGAQYPNIYNCDYGIWSHNGLNYFYDNKIEDVGMGVILSNSQALSVNSIYDNSIEAEWKGIFHGQGRIGIMNIRNNDIEISQTASPLYTLIPTGIYLRGFGPNPLLPPRIMENNVVSKTDGERGIFVESVANTRIRENSLISQHNTFGYIGIGVENSPNALIDYNTTSSTLAEDYMATGILLENSHRSRINCNSTSITRLGINILESCDGSEIKGNEIGKHHDAGLLYGYLNSSAHVHITGEQHHHGNIWDASYGGPGSPSSSIGARHMNTLSDIYELSLFLVDENENPDFITTRHPVDWFRAENAQGRTWECPENRPEGDWYDVSPRDVPTDLDIEIATGKPFIENVQFEQSLDYISKRNLYHRILEGYYSSTALALPVLDTFVTNMESSSIGIFFGILKDLSIVSSLDSLQLGEIDERVGKIRSAVAELIAIDSIAWLDTAAVDTAQWLIDRQPPLDTIGYYSVSLQNYYETIVPDVSSLVSSINSALTEITATSPPEGVEKYMLGIIANKVVMDDWEFNSSQKNNINAISEYCPAYGGPGVYWARSIRSTYDPGQVYNDTLCTESWAPRIVRPVEVEEPITVSLYPNPAQTNITIEFSEAIYSEWRMFNSEGRLIRMGSISADQTEFDIFIGMEFSGNYYLQFIGEEVKDTVVPFIKVQE